MCFTCAPIGLPLPSGYSIVYERDPDPHTQPSDLALDEVSTNEFHRGVQSCIRLCATVLSPEGVPLGASALYGVLEGPRNVCAFMDTDALAWVGAKALAQARPAIDDPPGLRVSGMLL